MGCGHIGTNEKENYNNQITEPNNMEIKIPNNKLKKNTSESKDSLLNYEKGKNFAKLRKKLTPEEIEDEIKQDKKEKEKRKNRKDILVQFKKNYLLNTRNQKVHMIQLHQSNIVLDMKMRYIKAPIMANQLDFIIKHGLHMMRQWNQILMVLEYKYLQDGEFQL